MHAATDKKQQLPERHIIPRLIEMAFSKNYQEAMTHYELEQRIELTEHLEMLMRLSEEDYEGNYRQYADAERELLKKYGSAFKPYRDKQFYLYPTKEFVFGITGIYDDFDYNRLPDEYTELTEKEIKSIARNCWRMLTGALDYLYLEREPQFSLNETNGAAGNAQEETHSGGRMTRSRQLLAIYFLLKSRGADHHSNTAAADIARLVHLFSNIPVTAVQNSDIYKKYREMPRYKKGRELLADLNYIRPFFEAVHLNEVIQLIDVEIAGLRQK